MTGHAIWRITGGLVTVDIPVTVEYERIPAEPDVGISGGIAVIAIYQDGEDITDHVPEDAITDIADYLRDY